MPASCFYQLTASPTPREQGLWDTLLYLMNIYGHAKTQQWFVDEFRASGKRLDMGKSCIRFKKLEELPIELIGKAIARTSVVDFIELYEASRPRPPGR